MTAIAILPERGRPGTSFRAVAGGRQSIGRTPGEALDSLTAQLQPDEAGTLVVVQHMQPDAFFTAAQQQRLGELMREWRLAREQGQTLAPAVQTELEELIEAELSAAKTRAVSLLRSLTP